MQNTSDAEWMIEMSKMIRPLDKYESNAWLLAAQCVFPENPLVILDAYKTSLISKEYVEAVRLLQKLITCDISMDVGIKQEINAIIMALYQENYDNSLQDDIYNYIPKELKKSILLYAADVQTDIHSYAKIMLSTFEKFPEAIESHGMELLERLMEHCNNQNNDINNILYQNVKNILVCEVTPIILKQRLSFRKEMLINLLKYAIDYFIENSLYQPEKNSNIKDNFATKYLLLSEVFKMVGSHLDWTLADVFEHKISQDQFEKIRKVYAKNVEFKTYAGNQEVFYAIAILFLHHFSIYLKLKGLSTLFDTDSIPTQEDKSKQSTLISALVEPIQLIIRSFDHNGSISNHGKSRSLECVYRILTILKEHPFFYQSLIKFYQTSKNYTTFLQTDEDIAETNITHDDDMGAGGETLIYLELNSHTLFKYCLYLVTLLFKQCPKSSCVTGNILVLSQFQETSTLIDRSLLFTQLASYTNATPFVYESFFEYVCDVQLLEEMAFLVSPHTSETNSIGNENDDLKPRVQLIKIPDHGDKVRASRRRKADESIGSYKATLQDAFIKRIQSIPNNVAEKQEFKIQTIFHFFFEEKSNIIKLFESQPTLK
ncbi:uncharacterized protein LOC135929375 isoform X2 [Gordionus sp. m RMFG-2023]|uniref:uncharacterized protein LOC135929375 isoform X2 n=1 Tax=Gordionus sp. m RMFG-2023 TaxID=3053472 RepID=UPI0031FE0FC7